MSRKYLIISIVSLVLISGGMALYYFLGIKESFEVIPPPNTEVQKLETSTGVSEVVSGEKSQEILQEIRGESNNTIFRAYKDRIMMIKDGVETELFSFVHILNIKADELMKYEYGIHELIFLTDKNVLLFKYHLGTEGASINGIDIDTKKYIWGDRGIDGRELYWSPDKKNLAIVWQYFESIKIFLTKDDDIRNIKEIVSTQRSENANFYWESNNTFIYKPNTTPDEEGFRKAIIESGFDPVINRFSVRDTNSTSFSPSQISEILTKINENTKKQEEIRKNTTGISEENYLVNYTPNKGVPGGEVVMNIAGSGQVFTVGENILYFDGFSPSKYYLIYTSEKLNNITSKYLRDITTGETIEFYGCSMGLWTIDKKRYICNNSRGGMIVSKYGDLLQTKTVQDEMIFSDFYTDDRYIYGIGHNKFSLKEYRYLKVFDLNTLKEVYSQEIK